METIFSKKLVQLRKDAGFPTAYRFYHDNGGKGMLKISYRKYLLIEQGKSLPSIDRLNIFLFALRIVNKSAEANDFVAAWLKTLVGEENYGSLIEPLISPKPGTPGYSPMQEAMKKALSDKKYYLDPGQVEVIAASKNNYLCFTAVSNDSGAWSREDFSARIGVPLKDVSKSLKELASAKLVKEIKKGVYKCPFAGAMLEYPHMATLDPSLMKKMNDHDAKLVAEGAPVWTNSGIIRADEVALRSFFPIMGLNICTAQTYAITEKTDRSALFMIEGRITKLRKF